MARHAAPHVRYVPADQCDRCNARAQVRAILGSGRELLFCGHHARAHHDALARATAWLEDLPDPSVPITA